MKLLHPVVATELDLSAALVTLPAGATIEYETSPSGLAEARWAGKVYRTHLQDLLDALPVEDAARCSYR